MTSVQKYPMMDSDSTSTNHRVGLVCASDSTDVAKTGESHEPDC